MSELENEAISRFIEFEDSDFKIPSLRVINDSKMEGDPGKGAKHVGAIANLYVNNISAYTQVSGFRREEEQVLADSIHDVIHSFYAQKRYDVEDFIEVTEWLNKSYDRRMERLFDTEDNWQGIFGESAMVYSSESKEFTFIPEISEIERSVARSLKENELIELYDEYEARYWELKQNLADAPAREENRQLKELEQEFETEAEKIIQCVPYRRIKQAMDPIIVKKTMSEWELQNEKPYEDEAIAQVYESINFPNQKESDIENALNWLGTRPWVLFDEEGEETEHMEFLRNPIPFNHDSGTYSLIKSDDVDVNYRDNKEQIQDAFLQETDRYRELRDKGYDIEEAADQILEDFLENIEPIN